MTKITLTARRPRNPLVALAHRRQAGPHRRSESSARQAAQRQLRHEMSRQPDWRSP